jgi:hypothetical protein
MSTEPTPDDPTPAGEPQFTTLDSEGYLACSQCGFVPAEQTREAVFEHVLTNLGTHNRGVGDDLDEAGFTDRRTTSSSDDGRGGAASSNSDTDTATENDEPNPLVRFCQWLKDGNRTVAARQWVRRKTDDQAERAAIVLGLFGTLRVWPQLAGSGDFWALVVAVGFIVIASIAGMEGWLSTSPRLQQALDSERAHRTAETGLGAQVSNKTGKTIQFGFGAALGILVGLAADALGYPTPQLLDVLRTLATVMGVGI